MKQTESVGLSRIINSRGIFWYATAAFKSDEGVHHQSMAPILLYELGMTSITILSII